MTATSADESIAVRKDWPILLGIMQKGLDSLSEEEVQRIFTKWVVQGGVEPTTKATAEATPPEPVAQPVLRQAIVNEGKQLTPSLKNLDAATTMPSKSNETSDTVSKLKNTGLGLSLLLLGAFYVIQGQKKQRQNKADAPEAVSYMSSSDNNSIPDTEQSHLQADQRRELPPEPSLHQPILLDIEQLKSAHEDQSLAIERENIGHLAGIVRYQRDSNGIFTYVSPGIISLLGYPEVDFKENFRFYLSDNPINQQWDNHVEACLQGRPTEVYELEIYDVSRAVHRFEVREVAVYDGLGHCTGIEGEMRDITLHLPLQVESTLEPALPAKLEQALQDQLELAIAAIQKHQTAFALIYLALERLRLLDGTLVAYHENEVLKEANKRLRATLRDTDTVLVLESDKFGLILPETNSHTGGLIVDKIRKILQVPYLVGVQSFVLDANMGIAIYPDDGIFAEDLISQARNFLPARTTDYPTRTLAFGYDNQAEINLKLQQDLVLVLDECKVSLRAMHPNNINALQRHSQFLVYYQSRHNLEDYVITGFEALIRWQHPDLGLLLPKDFVDLVKDIGMLDVMTYWIVQQTGFQAMVWEQKKIRPKLMAINLVDLASNQAVEPAKIANIIKETGAKPGWFVFSIPESEVFENHATLLPIIEQLVGEGFMVAIENVSLETDIQTHLKTSPAQIIELDSALIRRVSKDKAKAESVASTIALLHGMGKTVIAKEVETEQQLEFLKTANCDMIQGHLLSRPLPANEAKALIEALPDFAWFLKQ